MFVHLYCASSLSPSLLPLPSLPLSNDTRARKFIDVQIGINGGTKFLFTHSEVRLRHGLLIKYILVLLLNLLPTNLSLSAIKEKHTQ